jgi:hypothetical protein
MPDLSEPLPSVDAWWPGWLHRVRRTTPGDERVLNELRAALLSEGIEDMDLPRHDTPGAYIIEHESGVVGALVLRMEHLSSVYVAAAHRQRGVGFIALGVVAEQYFQDTDVPALGVPATSVASKALASSLCDPGRRYLTRPHWLAVVRPRVLAKLRAGPPIR